MSSSLLQNCITKNEGTRWSYLKEGLSIAKTNFTEFYLNSPDIEEVSFLNVPKVNNYFTLEDALSALYSEISFTKSKSAASNIENYFSGKYIIKNDSKEGSSFELKSFSDIEYINLSVGSYTRYNKLHTFSISGVNIIDTVVDLDTNETIVVTYYGVLDSSAPTSTSNVYLLTDYVWDINKNEYVLVSNGSYIIPNSSDCYCGYISVWGNAITSITGKTFIDYKNTFYSNGVVEFGPVAKVYLTNSNIDGGKRYVISGTTGGKIQYSIDSSEWIDYSVPLDIKSECSIRAQNINVQKEGNYIPDSIIVIDYVYKSESPVIVSPIAGEVTIICPESESSSIKYKLNDSDWITYTEPFKPDSSCTVYARNVLEGFAYSDTILAPYASNKSVPILNLNEPQPRDPSGVAELVISNITDITREIEVYYSQDGSTLYEKETLVTINPVNNNTSGTTPVESIEIEEIYGTGGTLIVNNLEDSTWKVILYDNDVAIEEILLVEGKEDY